MPSTRSRAAKAATAARVAAYNAAAAALDAEPPVKATSIGKVMNIIGRDPRFDALNEETGPSNVGALTSTDKPSMPFKPMLPSMLNLNTSPNMNRALAVGAVTVGNGGHTGNPSDEENVQPMVPRIAPTSNRTQKGEEIVLDGVGYVARPLSPILGNINEKNVRAHEFERQKVKRAGELAKRKAAKVAKIAGGYNAGSGGNHTHSGRGVPEGDGGRKEVKSKIGPDDMDVDIARMLVEKPVTKITSGFDTKVEMPSDGRVEVSLSEFVLRQKKPRKSKGQFIR